DNEVHLFYTIDISLSQIDNEYKMGVMVFNEDFDVLLDVELPYEYERKVFGGPLPLDGFYYSRHMRGKISIKPIAYPLLDNNHVYKMEVIKTDNFYYVIVQNDHKPSYTNQNNQIILQAYDRMNLLRYDFN